MISGQLDDLTNLVLQGAFTYNRTEHQVENAITPLVVGRKNQLFSDTPEGAEARAITYRLIDMTKANLLNVERYLLSILTVLADRFAADTLTDVSDLLPLQDDMKKQFPM